MSDEAEGFARRWSRRKRQALAATPPEPVALVVPEEPIELPPPADTIPLDEIGQWLGKRLPDGWREAALRRVWSADIAIRDFVGPADYAWDFTTLGAAPGWGPLRAGDDMVRLLSRAIGEAEPPPLPEPEPEPVEPEPAPIAAEPPPIVAAEAPEISSPPPPQTPLPRIARRGGRAAPVDLADL